MVKMDLFKNWGDRKRFAFQEDMLRDLIEGMESLENTFLSSKNEFAIQGTTGCGKTHICYGYIQYLLDKYKESKLAVFYVSPSNGGLPFQTEEVMKGLHGAKTGDAASLLAYGVEENVVYCLGHAIYNKRNNKLTFEKLEKAILDASADGFKLVIIIDEAHSNAKMVERLSNLPFNQVIYVSATLPASINDKLQITRDMNKGYWNRVSVSREVVKRAGLINGPVYINPDRFINAKNKKKAEILAKQKGINDFCMDFYLIYVSFLVLQMAKKAVRALETFKLLHPDTGKLIKYTLPCLVLLLPDNRTDGTTEENKEETQKDIELALKYAYACGFTEEEIGIWTASVKKNINNLSSEESKVTLLISKQAIKEGWDCPRCFAMTKLRDISNWTFETQVVGRIKRNPLLTTYESIINYSKNQKKIQGRHGNTIKQSLLDIFTPIVLTFEGDLEAKLKATYDKEVIGGVAREKSSGEYNPHLSRDVAEAYNHIRVHAYKTRNHDNRKCPDDSMFLSLLSSNFTEYMITNLGKVKPITNKVEDVFKRNHLNISKLHNCLGYDFEDSCEYLEGVSEGEIISKEEDKLVSRKSGVKTQYRNKDIKTILEQTSKLLGCTLENARFFWEGVVSQGRLADGDAKLLFLNENDTLYFLTRNGDKLLQWLTSYVLLYQKELLTLYRANDYDFNIGSEALRPYCDANSTEVTRKNHLYKDTKRNSVVTERGHLSEHETKLEDDIFEDRLRDNHNWFKNGPDGEPYFGIAYKVENKVVKPEGFKNEFSLQGETLDEYHNFYPDYLTDYEDVKNKVIYLSIVELKLPFGLKDGYPNGNIKEKFAAMVVECDRLSKWFSGFRTTNGFSVKVTFSLVRKADTSADSKDYYALFADNEINKEDVLVNMPTAHWEKFDCNDVLETKVMAHSK